MKWVNKSAKLREAIENFEQSERNEEDYLKLFVVVESSLRQGSGLTWGSIQEIIKEALNQK